MQQAAAIEEWLATVEGYTPTLNVAWKPAREALGQAEREQFLRGKVEGIEAILDDASLGCVRRGHVVRLYDPEKLCRARRQFNELVYHLCPYAIDNEGEVDFQNFKRTLLVSEITSDAGQAAIRKALSQSDLFASLIGNAQEVIPSTP